jgi:serine/threonine-protein kinase RsbW
MTSPAEDPVEVEYFELILPSEMRRVGEIVEAVLQGCAARNEIGATTRFRLCTVVAEAVANAIAYGNQHDPARRVLVQVESGADCIRVGVSDEGDGFDPSAVPEPTDAACHEATRGRGLFMIRQLSADVTFNARGNTIWMTLPRH